MVYKRQHNCGKYFANVTLYKHTCKVFKTCNRVNLFIVIYMIFYCSFSLVTNELLNMHTWVMTPVSFFFKNFLFLQQFFFPLYFQFFIQQSMNEFDWIMIIFFKKASLLGTWWFQELIWVWVHNQTKINWGP